jgi:hypothetical protein
MNTETIRKVRWASPKGIVAGQVFKSRILRALFLAVAAISLSAVFAAAEDYHGEFTLPLDAQWGKVDLPAGTYSFTMNIEKAPYTIKVQRGSATAIFIWPAGKSPGQRISGASSLTATRRGHRLRIRFLALAEEGVVFNFTVPQSEKVLMAETPELIQRIPILMASK